uniref:BPI fold-containing family B member 1 n=1 Tax=Jaculus jaculus TaxID=51337 RepID=UPI001E1B519A|nr:BPI fold-containing family B member 1 [Jaculus jaculus]
MAGMWTLTLLCALLGAASAGAILRPPAVLKLGPEVIRDRLMEELKKHNAKSILQKLPLLSAMREEPAGGIPLLSDIMGSIMKYIIGMKIISANILQPRVHPSSYDQELVVRIPLDMVVGFNTLLVSTLVEFHLMTEAQALVRIEKSEKGPNRLALDFCSSSQNSLSVSLLKKLSFMLNPFADKVTNLLMPALPKVVNKQLCPVIQAAFNDMYTDLLTLVQAPISLSPGGLQFDVLSLGIEHDSVEVQLKAELLDSKARVTQSFNSSVASQGEPIWDGAPFSLTLRQDVVNAIIEAMLPQEEFVFLLGFSSSHLDRELKKEIQEINKTAAEKLEPTQMVKVFMQQSPVLLLNQDSPKAAQQFILDFLPNNKDDRPFFSLGIEANTEVQFYTENERLRINFNDISCDRISLMISDIGLFHAEHLDGVITKILNSLLLPNQNEKMQAGIPIPLAKALGYSRAVWRVIEDSLRLAPISSFWDPASLSFW